jgi:hypothetical protein
LASARRVLVIALLLAVAQAGGAGARTGSLTVTSRLPAWLAPRAPLTVSGFAGSRARVSLVSNGLVLARTTSGRFGRYLLKARAPAAGGYAIRVASNGRSASAGALLVRPVELAAVGDVTSGEQVGPAVGAHGGSYPWSSVGAILRGADVATANLEGAVSERGAAVGGKQYTFRGPASLLAGAARYGGLDVLTLANNHSGDFGPEALLDTLRNVHAAGIATIGAGADEAAAHRPAIVEAGGLRIAFLGYSDINPPGFAAGLGSPGTARADEAGVADDVRRARRSADVVVCFFHWGVEGRAEPDTRQRSLATAALDAGAQVVLGAHPHVFGRVERPGSHTLVAWTLGNFVFPAGSAAASRTGILLVGLSADGVAGWRVVAARAGVVPQLQPA